jgi:hypothetical protein
LELTCRSFCAGREKGIATRRDGIGVSRAFRCVARRDDVDPGAPDQGAVRRQHGAPQDSGTQNIVLCLSKFGRLLSRIAVFGALALTTVYLPDPMSLTLGSAPGHSVLRWGAPIIATKRREGKVSRVILRDPSALALARQGQVVTDLGQSFESLTSQTVTARFRGCPPSSGDQSQVSVQFANSLAY